ncbi:MAG: dipeptidase, partial [Actinomycetia bacterium]|nr:dipeptidase [Actinomycetes bacterium]
AMQAVFGVEPTQQGQGGSVPFVANLAEELPDIEVLGVGAQDPLARIHAPNESVNLAELQSTILTQALFLSELGATWAQP